MDCSCEVFFYFRLLAALHYNENHTRKQSTTKSEKNDTVSLTQNIKEGAILLVQNMNLLFSRMLLKIVLNNFEDIELRSNIIVPPPLCASYEHPSKDKAINKHQSRYNNI